ncbi:helix-turn-helix domain-containing protein [Nocardia rhizosphaerae]|uniref:Helix-turn-helix domain-containing protein n=1 Tax=Nocardia rhizosphaerae TaxID=1691571 RepID=A0ABV8LAK8_9NOCA
MSVMHPNREIGTSDASRILGVTVATVTRWALSGYLPHLHKAPGPRGHWMFDESVVSALAHRRTEARRVLGLAS